MLVGIGLLLCVFHLEGVGVCLCVLCHAGVDVGELNPFLVGASKSSKAVWALEVVEIRMPVFVFFFHIKVLYINKYCTLLQNPL